MRHLLLLLLLVGAPAFAATAYDPQAAFAPFRMPEAPSAIRAADGTPAPGYWQNRADYEIHATLDPATKTLRATEVIAYTNNSPQTLDSLWLQLDQNLNRPGSRSAFQTSDPVLGTTQGFVIDGAEIEAGGRATQVAIFESDTRGKVALPQPLRSGGQVRLRIRYHYLIPPEAWGQRSSWGRAKAGEIYDIAQWYPRMAVYDDQRGWDTAPFLAQEFYLDYGRFDYWITAPSDMLVAGSGALLNADEVLSKAERERLDRARQSDTTVMIRSAAEVAALPPATGTRTWHFRMDDTRDVAFTASRHFIWDAARINLPGGKAALAQSVYPAESAGPKAWGRSTEYTKHAIEEFSRRWYPYPWPNAVSVAGPTSGMEYPGMVFDGITDAGKELFWVTAHEFGHGWFPMIVGFDERRDAWMDEGFNTFIDVYESDAFNHGEYAPKRDSEYAPHGGNPVDEIVPIIADPKAPPILTRADAVEEKYRHPITYFKSALGLVLLREQILGPARFDPAFRKFIRDWAFRHPRPSDFFRAMESEGGEDLSWWWRGWYENNWSLDFAVTGVSVDAKKGTTITVEARDKLVMPATLRIAYADGTSRDIRLPVETWIQRAVAPLHVDGARPIASVTIDPDHKLPDKNRANDVFVVRPETRG